MKRILLSTVAAAALLFASGTLSAQTAPGPNCPPDGPRRDGTGPGIKRKDGTGPGAKRGQRTGPQDGSGQRRSPQGQQGRR